MAQKLRTSQEKALRAILRAEHSRKAYKNIRLLIEKENKPLTQVDILSSPTDPTSPHTTITTKDDIETHILQRNRHHSLQSLPTPFMSHPTLCTAVGNEPCDEQLDLIFSGQFTMSENDLHNLNETQKEWINSL
jgi:hypothetical protein